MRLLKLQAPDIDAGSITDNVYNSIFLADSLSMSVLAPNLPEFTRGTASTVITDFAMPGTDLTSGAFPSVFELSSLLAVNGGDGMSGFVINGIDVSDQSGLSVSSAGDINGDGFDDIIIGARNGDPNGSNSGESYVVFGKMSGFGASLELSSLNGTNGFVINGIDADDLSGRTVSSAGDINGDGFDDILIGAQTADPNGSSSGESYVIFGKMSGFSASFELSSLNGNNGFVLNGIDADDQSGVSVSSAGDINGDGFDDILIGAQTADPNGSRSGESYVIFGKMSGFGSSLELSSLNGTNGFVINGIDATDFSGFPVSSAGDINGDGFDDIIIGAYGGDPNGSFSGESYVIFGKSSGFAASLDLSSLNGTNGFVINGIDANDVSGRTVSSAGDINGDGLDDIIIGARRGDPNGTDSGESYVIFGSSASFGASFELSSLNGTNGFVINGIDAYDSSGVSVSSAGDVNGDGFDDILIGAYFADPNGADSGESYVVFGSNAGFGASLNLSSLNGTNGFVINGIDGGDNSGVSVSSAGDINGDGLDDILVGARFASPNGVQSGESYLIYGQANSEFELSSLLAANGGDGSSGTVFNGINSSDGNGGAIASAGDINGDGFDDILIGASGGDTNASNSGESYIIFGNGSGFGASLNLSTLNGSNGFVINGIDANDFSGISVSSAGDINNDGFDDVLIGAERADPNGNNSGESYLILGSGSGFGASLNLSTLNGSNGFVINGIDTYDNSGVSVSSAGDINGDGFDDILIGAKGASPNGNSAAGESYVVFGSGSGFGSSFDLSTLNGINGFVINGIGEQDESGGSVSSAGDINGDGFDDIIIGASGEGPTEDNSGESYVIFGRGSGFGASLDLSSLNGTNGFVINGIDALDYSGVSVSKAGDINGDGLDDLIIGARGGDPNGNRSGESYVIFGNSSGFGASLDLSSLNGTNGFIINGIFSGDDSGDSVSSAGDINGDGFDDILIGARGANPNGSDSGQSYVIFGSGSGFEAVLELYALDGTNGFVINGIDALDTNGETVSSAGDVNGDGFDDLLLGAPAARPNGGYSGETYLIYGQAEFGRTIQILSVSNDIYTASDNGEVVRGLTGDDVMNGGAASDVLFGDEGDDMLSGNVGNDRLEGGAGNDSLDGGDGEDTAIYNGNLSDYGIINNGVGTFTVTDNVNGNGVDTLTNIEYVQISTEIVDLSTILFSINGTPGNDNLLGTAGDDIINGLAGNDIIDGLAGNDEINGGDGSDTLIGSEGADALNGGADFDTVDYRGATSGVRFNVDTGGTVGEASGDTFSDIERYFLSNFNDIITGSDANEFFFGEDGNDTINGGGGIDRIDGGAGNDILRGDAGNDLLFGSAGSDQLNGGTGFDIASYENSTSAVIVNLATGGIGGDANGDTYFGIEVVRGSDFNDTLTGNNSVNELRGGDGDDALNGGGGNDRLFGGDGADSFDGGAGIDIVSYTVAAAGVTLDLTIGGTAGEAAGDTFTSIEWVFGSDFDDSITGDAGNNRLEGREGNDTLNGAGGNDRLLGGDGNDTINGGDGVDTIFGQAGDDVMTGGAGNDFFFGDSGADSHDGGTGTDTVSYLASSTGVTVNMQTGGTGGEAAGDTYTSIERIFGSGQDDSLTGSNGNDTLLGNGGNDFLTGGQGNDSLNGGAGVDSFAYNTTQDDADVIQGFTTNEVIDILFTDPAFDSFAEIMAVAVDAGANTLIDFGSGNTLTIVGQNIADLSMSNFTFTSLTMAEPLTDMDYINAELTVLDDFMSDMASFEIDALI